MTEAGDLRRVAILDRGEEARRVLRAVRELARGGHASATVVIHPPQDRLARYVREADETVERQGSLEDALRTARADTGWLGQAPLTERAVFAETCDRLGIRHVGPPAEVLRRLCAPNTLKRLVEQLRLPDLSRPSTDSQARLIEVVVARDRRGTTRSLGLGETSLRLGEVAVLTESPSAALSDAEDAGARELALQLCAAAGWVGLGVVRLLLDPGTRRLSPVGLDAFAQAGPSVEMVEGIDLTRLALWLAAGFPLERAISRRRGYAAAVRVLAQDPENPSTAIPCRVERLRVPSDPSLRSSAAVEEGDEISCNPDDTLAVLVAHAESRTLALARLEQALVETDLLLRGTATSRAWLLALCARPEVQRGEAGVGLVSGLASSGSKLVTPRPEAALIAAAIEAYDIELDQERSIFLAEARRGRPRVGPSSGRTIELRYDGHRHRLDVRQVGPNSYRISPESGAPVDARFERLGAVERRLVWQDRRWRALSSVDGLRLLIEVDGVPHLITRDPGGVVVSPMPAVVVAIPVSPGQQVAAGEPVARIESMKVEVAVTAPAAGIVREVVTIANAQVDAGAPLVRLELLDGGPPPQPAPEPLSLGAGPQPMEPRDRYLASLDELRRLALGFDVATTESRRLAATIRELSGSLPVDDLQVQASEEAVLRAFAEIQALFSRAVGPNGDGNRRPPLEELWRYLHEPQARGAGLSESFVATLRRALSHFGLSLEEPGRALELALLRIQKAYVRCGEQMTPLLAILERRLSNSSAQQGLSGGEVRELLDGLVKIGQERCRALSDLARELRYQRFDRLALERVRAEAYARIESDLERLPAAPSDERDALIARLVDCPQPLTTLLLSRAKDAGSALRPRLVEILLRRYYRKRPLEQITALDFEGLPCTWADYEKEGRLFRAAACFSPYAELEQAARKMARFVAGAPRQRELAVEFYLWQESSAPPPDELAEALAGVLSRAGFARPLVRVSITIATADRGLGPQDSQQHFTFRGGPTEWSEDKRYRGVHYMLFQRLQLARLSKFDLERLPSVEDVYLYRGVAQGNPKDERLFAAAEIRDLTPVRDSQGRVVQLPQLERMLHEALAGMRRFQARRAEHQRLEWNRVALTVDPPLMLSRDEIRRLIERLAPATEGLGLEMVSLEVRLPEEKTGELRDTLVRMITMGRSLNIRYDAPTERPLEPMTEYQQRVIQVRRRGLTHPVELIRMLAPPAGSQGGVPQGEFIEYDLDTSNTLVPVERPLGTNSANMVVGVVRNFTGRYPEGMRRVVLLGDPSRAMGSLAEPECRRIAAAIDLAQRLGVPLEWFAVSAGAKISMESGTENMDWISHVLRRIIEFTQGGGEINVVVTGINVGAQPYWNAESTMLMHTKGILVMTPGSAMVLTGKDALDYSGSVSAEDNQSIGGYDRIMGPNGQAQYRAGSLGEAIQILLRHYEHCYVAPGERFPRRAHTSDPLTRDIRSYPHGPVGGAGFTTVGEVFSSEHNPDRKKPFDIRRIMAAVVDQDHPSLERWRDMRGSDTAVIWDAHLGGWPVCLIGIEARPIPRLEYVPADGPDHWSSGTLFPQSSKKVARAVNAASGVRPVVVMANLSGFDGSPESMRRLQLEYGAEIGRAVVNFKGPIVFCVVSRYHGGAFVVFSKTLRQDIEVVAVEGARASVIGGAPAAAVVFAREVDLRTRKDPRVQEAERAAAAGGSARARLAEVVAAVRSEKLGEVGEEFDGIHTVERALKVGSLDRILAPADLRPYLIDAVERGIARADPSRKA